MLGYCPPSSPVLVGVCGGEPIETWGVLTCHLDQHIRTFCRLLYDRVVSTGVARPLVESDSLIRAMCGKMGGKEYFFLGQGALAAPIAVRRMRKCIRVMSVD